MGSITVAQAALFAAIAMVLLAGFYLVDDFALLQSMPVLVLLGTAVPSFIWAAFFFGVSRSSALAKTAAWITLVFAVLLEAVIVYIRFQQSVSYWTPFGSALSVSGWLLRLGWAAFLIAFALNRPVRWIALVLAILSAPSALNTAYGAFNNGIGLLLDEIPRQALWRVLITPAMRTIYWVSQILLLWKVWTASPLEQSSSRLAP